MTYDTTKRPYELLIRWDQTGALAGAHVQHRLVTTDDAGAVVGETVLAAEPLALAAGPGFDFPLGDLLSEAQQAAVMTTARALQERDAAIAERDALAGRLAALEGGAQPA